MTADPNVKVDVVIRRRYSKRAEPLIVVVVVISIVASVVGVEVVVALVAHSLKGLAPLTKSKVGALDGRSQR